MDSSEGAYLILGLGELGMAMVLGLVNRVQANQLTVLVRPQNLAAPLPGKESALSKLRSMGVQVVNVDLAAVSLDQLSAIFARFQTVIGCTGFASSTPIQLKICRAVLQARVARYIPWQFGVDYDVIGRGSAQDLFDEQFDVRELLRAQSETDWIIVSTGMFTSFLFDPLFGVVDLKQKVVHALGSESTAITVTTAKDIGTLTAEILLFQPPIRNTVVYTAGDTITYMHLSQILGDLLGHSFRCENWSISELEEALSKSHNDAMSKYRVVFAKGDGVSWPKTQSFNAQHRLSTTDVEQWAREHLAQLRG